MASFSIQWRSSTKKDLRKLPPREVQRIVTEVESLGEEPFPHGSEKLAGAEHFP
jgi:mRNA-degrading endonuclease RelE of RelBE toxin-antitoxin system